LRQPAGDTSAVDAENTPELMAVIERQKARHRPDCPFIFHGRRCGEPARLDHHGRRRLPRRLPEGRDKACIAAGFVKPDPADAMKVKVARTPHDLRRSGVSTTSTRASTRTP
jgi:hypothetical protein